MLPPCLPRPQLPPAHPRPRCVWRGQGRSPPRTPGADAVPPLPAAWYSVLALLVLVPALLGYLQETCRARPSEPELVRRRYHSVRREDLRRVQLSRQEAIVQVKSL